tara:strand:+ start:4527 stop:5099 length:573 start_codon:yes stop_codon:yes gene_type:complete
MTDFHFYKESLIMACDNIKEKKKTKALKDVIGKEFEEHRKRVWTHFGFTVSKERELALWDVDWNIKNREGKTIAFEEDKAHYLDSCFLERALTGFAKTVNSYLKNNKEVPCIILHSFTSYSKYEAKLNEFCEILQKDISKIMREKMVYITLCERDRLPTKKWFQNCDYAYIDNINDELIHKDIAFIKSLI